jgi:hypothetical protein
MSYVVSLYFAVALQMIICPPPSKREAFRAAEGGGPFKRGLDFL